MANPERMPAGNLRIKNGSGFGNPDERILFASSKSPARKACSRIRPQLPQEQRSRFLVLLRELAPSSIYFDTIDPVPVVGEPTIITSQNCIDNAYNLDKVFGHIGLDRVPPQQNLAVNEVR